MISVDNDDDDDYDDDDVPGEEGGLQGGQHGRVRSVESGARVCERM